MIHYMCARQNTMPMRARGSNKNCMQDERAFCHKL
jgi:hypothetical protein